MASIELLTVGTELLLGFTVDTNSAEIGRTLAAAGVSVARRTTVGDDGAAIRDAVSAALRRSGVVLVTGGLGPTADDVTKKAVAELFDAPLEFQQSVWDALVSRFARMGRVPSPVNRCQAEVPRGATVLPNRWGTAPGLWLEGSPGIVIMLPGVPHEMRNLLTHEVLPRLSSRAGTGVVRSRAVRTWGVPESSLAEKLSEVENEVAPLSLAYLPGITGVDLRLTAWDLPAPEADERLATGIKVLRARIGDPVYGEDEDDLAALVLEQARRIGLSIATAESCTGGLVGARLTEVPGSSEVYLGGIVAYSNAAKVAELNVSAQLIVDHGAVSEQVARAMATGAVHVMGAEAAMAVTGIAGPGGGTPEKPVGLVYVAAAVGGESTCLRYQFPGGRDDVRGRAAQAALFQLWRMLQEMSPALA
jgi:competence/damage-inducible protein CinA-like protein